MIKQILTNNRPGTQFIHSAILSAGARPVQPRVGQGEIWTYEVTRADSLFMKYDAVFG